MRRRLLQPLLLPLPLPVLVLPFRNSRPPPHPRVVHGHLDDQGESFPPVQKPLRQGHGLKPRQTLSVEIQQLGGVSTVHCPVKVVAASSVVT